MDTILKIENEVVTIGKADGTFIEVKLSDLQGFVPKVGDKVKVFVNGDKIMITKDDDILSKVSEALADGKGRKVNKIIYLIICWFLGMLGIHMFYAGRNTRGAIMLCMCVIGVVFSFLVLPSLLLVVVLLMAIYDFIRGIFNAADSDGNIVV